MQNLKILYRAFSEKGGMNLFQRYDRNNEREKYNRKVKDVSDNLKIGIDSVKLHWTESNKTLLLPFKTPNTFNLKYLQAFYLCKISFD